MLHHSVTTPTEEFHLSNTVCGLDQVVRELENISPVPCPCGQSTRIVTAKDGVGLSFHITEIHEASRHYHRHTTEVYHILSGTGVIELDGETSRVKPGTTVIIHAGVRHRVVADDVIRTVVIAKPAFDPADEFLD